MFLKRQGKILLGMKKCGFGAGRWNGFGGKIETGETTEGAARRELFEEVGIFARELARCGRLEFSFPTRQQQFAAEVFVGEAWEGVPRETAEMKPRWFAFADIPYEHMWPDDKHWLPLLLADEYFEGSFEFADEDTLTAVKVKHHVVH